MCGICGIFGHGDGAREVVQQMNSLLEHRGPDGVGEYRDGPIALGHRRLSVIDLDTGAQPMQNNDQSLSIVFNGEIYNYRELRADLVARGYDFATQSDTNP